MGVSTYLSNRVPPGAEAMAAEEQRWTEQLREMGGRAVEVEGRGAVVLFPSRG
ncbi:hypothetical protein CXB51_031080 [Gossypium anomalum]|uniref:Uncharacterized protein n=1 Tax=Gossypium anomalum TaxID=47600 RepID=A0A8J5Y445_9ROSI|nr:hypothetical protein CXB51_031080 [Gossypium anomalum]